MKETNISLVFLNASPLILELHDSYLMYTVPGHHARADVTAVMQLGARATPQKVEFVNSSALSRCSRQVCRSARPLHPPPPPSATQPPRRFCPAAYAEDAPLLPPLPAHYFQRKELAAAEGYAPRSVPPRTKRLALPCLASSRLAVAILFVCRASGLAAANSGRT